MNACFPFSFPPFFLSFFFLFFFREIGCIGYGKGEGGAV